MPGCKSVSSIKFMLSSSTWKTTIGMLKSVRLLSSGLGDDMFERVDDGETEETPVARALTATGSSSCRIH